MSSQAEMLVVCFLSLFFSAVLYPSYIQWLKKKQVEQFLREDGPQSHAHKAKTPTMGGVVFSIVATIASIGSWFFLKETSLIIPVAAILAVAVLCGMIGFIDDYAKFAQKNNKGISGYIRFSAEVMLGALLGLVLLQCSHQMILVPFAGQLMDIFGGHASVILSGLTGQQLSVWVPPWLIFIPLSSFLIVATANSLNLHDGMDGLAGGTASQVFASLAIMLFATGQVGYALIAASAAGALCGFLLFNRNPAKIFMGDTGSLFIGGLIGALVVAGGLVIWFVPLALVYILESLSVIIQVVTFKLTKKLEGEEKMPIHKVIITKLTKRIPGDGKRVFRMAPLHHHYEAVFADKGVPEWQVVAMFWVVQFLICAATLLVFFNCNG
ncbi:MAG: phospho-N-acetylmuramoyl-pentapeptide-transferase [Candidatus Melainabacteria bacterium]|nr:phospho-N-acetylmuramoyl-pentapeptide-transferase [Candidatus Melainabacteria bacterium]